MVDEHILMVANCVEQSGLQGPCPFYLIREWWVVFASGYVANLFASELAVSSIRIA